MLCVSCTVCAAKPYDPAGDASGNAALGEVVLTVLQEHCGAKATEEENLAAVYDFVCNDITYRAGTTDTSGGFTDELTETLAPEILQKRKGNCDAQAALMAALCLLCAPALAMREAYTDPILAELRQPMVLGCDTFEHDGVSFHRVLLPRYIVERYDESEYAIQPGQSDARVREVKRALYSDTTYPKNEFVTYTQVRADEPVETYFDDHLAELLSTIYMFCGLEDKTPCIDELTMLLLAQIPALSEDMRHDMEAMYKYRLTKSRTYGTVARSGKVDDLYYFAQTDPDWAGEIFEFEGNGAMLKDRGCGCACAAMVFSTYHKVEITPRWMRTYALQDDYPVSCGLPNEYFEGIARYYKNLEYERYGTTLEVATIYQKSAVDMSALSDQTITLTKTASDWDALHRHARQRVPGRRFSYLRPPERCTLRSLPRRRRRLAARPRRGECRGALPNKQHPHTLPDGN